MAHPLGQQCTATAKGTGRRCERRAIAANVCYIHGGRAKQVRQKQEQRLAVYDAQVAAAQEPVVLQRREAEEVLIDLLDDVTRILAQIKSELHGNIVSPALLAVAGEWMDRTARVAKLITDGDLATKLHERLGWLARDRADTLLGHIAAVVTAAPLTAADKLRLWESVGNGLRLIERGEMPFRFSDGERRRFGDRLQVAAAKEQALAEGLSWGEESESDSDAESDSDVLAEVLPLDGALL